MLVQNTLDKLECQPHINNARRISLLQPRTLQSLNPKETESPTVISTKLIKSRVIHQSIQPCSHSKESTQTNGNSRKSIEELAQKVVNSICLQLDIDKLKSKGTFVINLNSLTVSRIYQLKTALIDLKHNHQEPQNETDNHEKEKTAFNIRHSKQEIKKYIDRESQAKGQITKLLESVSGHKYEALNLFQQISRLSSTVSDLKKAKDTCARLQNQNKKIRLHYIAEIEHFRSELKFIHEVVKQKQQQVREVEKQLFQFREGKHFWKVGSKEQLFNIQVSQPPMSRVDSVQMLVPLSPREGQSDSEKGLNGRQHSTPRLVTNPESHLKSKSEIGRNQQSENADKDGEQQKMLYTQLGSANSRIRQLNELLLERVQESQVQLAGRSEVVAALNEEIGLLQQNLAELTTKIEQKEVQYADRERQLWQLQQEIEARRDYLRQIEYKLQMLGQQQQIQQYNIQRTQQQLQFLQQQCQIVSAQIQYHKERRAQLFKDKESQVQTNDWQ